MTEITMKNEKNKRRSLIVTILVHSALLTVFGYPFVYKMQEMASTEVEVTTEYIEIVPAPEPKPEIRKVANTSTTTKNEVKIPNPAPEPKIEAPKQQNVTPTPTPASMEVERTPEPTPIPVPSTNSDATKINSNPSNTVKGNSSPTTKADGHGSNAGTNKGKAKGGGSDKGNGITLSSGRSVVKRADITKLTRKEGRIVLYVCVTQEGRVVAAKAQKQLSSIKDANLLKGAEYYAKQYRFDQDLKAPKTEWVQIIFTFEYTKGKSKNK